jgi:hypothetical protein
MVERGEYAQSVAIEGFPNGASVMYAVYAVVTVTTMFLVIRTNSRLGQAVRPAIVGNENARAFASRLIFLNTTFLVIMLLGFEGLKVWSGEISKGAFRVGLGPLSGFAYLMTKYVVPALFAYSCLLFLECKERKLYLLYLNALLVVLIGSTWGFKTTSIAMLTPAIILVFWKVNVRQTLSVVGLGILVIVIMYQAFDVTDETNVDASAYDTLLYRTTVLQGDVAWYIWQVYTDGETFPAYLPTLLAAFGDNILSGFGFNRNDHYQWMLVHFDWMLNYTAGVPLYSIAAGHNLTGTAFSEGVIAGGFGGVLLFGIIAGVVTGLVYLIIRKSLLSNNKLIASLGSTYFSFSVMPWLNGGGITQLFHVGTIISIAVCWILILAMTKEGIGVLGRPRK